jgi:hypothetical protein
MNITGRNFICVLYISLSVRRTKMRRIKIAVFHKVHA